MPSFPLKSYQQQALDALRALCWHPGPKLVYGEACRLAAAGIEFKQLPHAVPR